MTIDDAATLVERYYAAFRAGDPARVADALAEVLAPGFILDSPLVVDRLGVPAVGPVATAVAVDAADMLQRADVQSLHFAPGGVGVVALIRFPTPAGAVSQSEHFDIDPVTLKITRLRSFYDPRTLLSLRAGTLRVAP